MINKTCAWQNLSIGKNDELPFTISFTSLGE